MQTRRHRCGFTLIELIAVVVVLGVMAVVALTANASLRGDAYRATAEGFAAAYRSAMHSARAFCVARTNGNGALNLPGIGDGTVDFNADCWPVGTGLATIPPGNYNSGTHPLLDADCVGLYQQLLRGGPQAAAGAPPWPSKMVVYNAPVLGPNAGSCIHDLFDPAGTAAVLDGSGSAVQFLVFPYTGRVKMYYEP